MKATEKLKNVIGKAAVNTVDVPPMQSKKSYVEEPKIVVSDFPYQVFHPKIQSIINDGYKYLSYPKNFTAASILAAASFAIGRKVRVQYLWDEGSVLYMVIVAPPGTCKSHPLSFAMSPLKKFDAKLYQEHVQDLQTASDDGTKSTSALKKSIHSDYTIESLGSYLNHNRKGVGVYIDELRGYFKNFERYSAGSQQEFWLENWSGGSLNVSRQGRTIYIEKTNISVVGTTQPSVLDEMGKDGRNVNGFIERFLYVIDEDVPVLKLKKRQDRSTTEYAHLHSRYLPIMQNLYDIPLPESAGDEREEWHTLVFEEQADDVLTDYINLLKSKMEVIENEYIRNIYSKMQSYVIRFSMLVELLDWACENNDFSLVQDIKISTDAVSKGILLADYFLQMALKANSLINFTSPVDKMPKDFRNFYRSLPEDGFSFGEGEKIAASHGYTKMTFSRYLKKSELFSKIRGGKESKYEKVAF